MCAAAERGNWNSKAVFYNVDNPDPIIILHMGNGASLTFEISYSAVPINHVVPDFSSR